MNVTFVLNQVLHIVYNLHCVYNQLYSQNRWFEHFWIMKCLIFLSPHMLYYSRHLASVDFFLFFTLWWRLTLHIPSTVLNCMIGSSIQNKQQQQMMEDRYMMSYRYYNLSQNVSCMIDDSHYWLSNQNLLVRKCLISMKLCFWRLISSTIWECLTGVQLSQSISFCGKNFKKNNLLEIARLCSVGNQTYLAKGHMLLEKPRGIYHLVYTDKPETFNTKN